MLRTDFAPETKPAILPLKIVVKPIGISFSNGLFSGTRWWQLKYFLFSPRKLGKISILTSIFFRWVGSTTNQLRTYPISPPQKNSSQAPFPKSKTEELDENFLPDFQKNQDFTTRSFGRDFFSPKKLGNFQQKTIGRIFQR